MKILACTVLLIFSLPRAEVKEIKKNIPLHNVRTIEVMGFNGASLDIKSWEKNEISVNIRVDFSQSDKEKEKENFRNIDVIQEQVGNSIILHFREPSFKNEGFSFKNFLTSLFAPTVSNLTVNGEIYLPSTVHLSSDMRYGEYAIDGIRGNLALSGVANTLTVRNCSSLQKIENNYGKTNIEHSGGTLLLTGESSQILVTDFNGSMNANASYATMKLIAITNNLTGVCTSGNVTIDGVGGNISFNASYATFEANNIKGTVALESQSGTLRVKNTGGVTITAPYSNVTIEAVNGPGIPVQVHNTSGRVDISDVTRDVTIDDSYSQLKLINIRGNVSVNSSGATFTGKKITGNFSMKNEYGDIRVDDLSSSTVEIVNKNNTVEIALSTKPAKINITNEYGPVVVSFPEFAGDVRLKASYGTIKTNLPIEVEEIESSSFAIGQIGNRNGSINIKTVSGNIEVQQRK